MMIDWRWRDERAAEVRLRRRRPKKPKLRRYSQYSEPLLFFSPAVPSASTPSLSSL